MGQPQLSHDSTIRRDAAGRWFHDGELVENDAVARAFDRWIARGPDGRYRLENTINWVWIELEGAPVFVKSVTVRDGEVWLDLSDDRVERLDPSTLRQDAEGVLYADVRGGTLAAQFTRKAQLMLEPHVAEDEDGVYLALGARVRPPVVDDPLSAS
ncbi:DUF1285 domain-containing protein [Myxococcota bacterium]|nr:DUF1285 domain-containing protein [Myxococcota bacterium]